MDQLGKIDVGMRPELSQYLTFSKKIVVEEIANSNNRKYKEDVLKNIMVDVCALLNTDGGHVLLSLCMENVNQQTQTANATINQFGTKYLRMIEQRVMEMIGLSAMITNVKLERLDQELIVLEIKKSVHFITMCYNVYFESETQIMAIQPTEPIEKVRELLFKKKTKGIKMGSHQKIFFKGENCGFQENKGTSFKNLKSDRSKCVTLGDRMVSKGNKFSCYVSAFANENGGHLYYGITDDGMVEGEMIYKEQHIIDIERKVEKTIKKMIWSNELDQPERGKHWQISFVLVLDVNSNIIPSTYVIVIYIAPYVGGVFIEEPESYEIVDNKPRKISFKKWMIRLEHPQISYSFYAVEQFPPAVPARCTWSSARLEAKCTRLSGHLQKIINDGNWNEFWRYDKIIKSKLADKGEDHESSIDISLVLLSKRFTAYCRKGHFNAAKHELEEFRKLLPKSKNSVIFRVMSLYLEAVLRRSKQEPEAINEILTQALQEVEMVPPGLIPAAVYSFGGIQCAITKGNTTTNDATTSQCDTSDMGEESRILSIKALEHLQYVEKYPEMKVDLKQKTHINLAMNDLGCSLAGCVIKDETKIYERSIASAKSHLKAVQSIMYQDGYGLSRFRHAQFELASLLLRYRCSQKLEEHDQKESMLKFAFHSSKQALSLARECNFTELERYAKKCEAMCTEELIKTREHQRCALSWLESDLPELEREDYSHST